MSFLDFINNMNINLNFSNNFNLWNKEKNIIIDPISCLIKLSILSLYPEGTKICISNNGISFCNPNLLQGSIRFVNGDAREDLHNLFKPIQKSIEWFANSEKYEGKIDTLFFMSQQGLTKLKKCYDTNSTIQHSLDYYISYISEYNNIHKNPKLKTENDNNDTNNQEDNNQTNPESTKEKTKKQTNSIIYNFLMSLWSKREVSIVVDLFNEYKTKEDEDEKTNILVTISNLTSTKEKLLNKFLKEQSSIL